MSAKSLAIDEPKETARIVSFIQRAVKKSSANGAVVAISGGVDSAVVGALCVRALGKGRVHGLLLPSSHTPKKDLEDAKRLAESWEIKFETVQISAIVNAIAASAKLDGSKIARANLEARTRMVLLYYFSNTLGYLVAGTGDRSEIELGYFTKGGDGLVDFLPIAHLYKTQVRRLGGYLGLPKSVVEKPASPQLWPGQKAVDELPAPYEKLDLVLHTLFDLRGSAEAAARDAGVPLAVVEKAVRMHLRSDHKRSMPPSLV